MKSTSRLVPLLALSITGALYAPPALALSCEDIINMVNVNVPANIVVATIQDSGEEFTAADIKCLTTQGAPESVIQAARRMMAEETSSSSSSASANTSSSSSSSSQSRPEDDFEGEERVGDDRRTRRTAFDDLPEEDEETNQPTGSCAQGVEEAKDALSARKPLGATKVLFDLQASGNCEAEASAINYYMGRGLYDLQFYHSAQHYFMEVVKKGPANPYFKFALPKVVAVSRYTGDDSDLLRIVTKISPDDYPREARNRLYYLMGIRLYEADKLTEARQYFSQISTKSELYLKSRYFEAVIANKQGKYKTAVKAFRDVINDANKIEVTDERELQEIKDIVDLSLIGVARIYYAIQRFDEATKYYEAVPHDSNYWPQALFEQSWTLFMLGDLNLALGKMLTLNSPYFSSDVFYPEARVLRALTFFNLCEYDQVDAELLKFERDYRPILEEMRAFTDRFRTKEGKELADQAYDAWFVSSPKSTILPAQMFKVFLRNKDLSSLVRHIDIMDDEVNRISAQKSLWLDSVGKELLQIIDNDKITYKRRAGLVLLSEMASLSQHLSGLLSQSKIIRFEVVAAQGDDYAYRINNLGDLVDNSRDQNTDFATSVDIIYWPFNGEFWVDELGYYRYTEQGSCR